MSEKKFLATARKNLTESQYDKVKRNLSEGNNTSVRYMVEDELDIATKAATDMVKRGLSDEVIGQRLQDVQSLYDSYMQDIEI